MNYNWHWGIFFEIILRHSSGARRWYIVFSRRWPRLFGMIDRVLRRRRHVRRRQAMLATTASPPRP